MVHTGDLTKLQHESHDSIKGVKLRMTFIMILSWGKMMFRGKNYNCSK